MNCLSCFFVVRMNIAVEEYEQITYTEIKEQKFRA